jgi:hypothetical protein
MRKLVLVCLIVALACGNNSNQSGNPPPPLGAPITGLTAGQWNWVPFADSTCGDGSPTGIGVNPGTGPDVVFFLNGGGACSSGLTCFGFGPFGATTTLGPFGEAQFNSEVPSAKGTILDRTLTGNPFADATLVFVPYCTGDVHGGNRVVTYTPGGTVHHTGHANIVAFLKRVAPTYPSPRRLVVSGSSAGGFGTLVNYDTFRSYYPASAVEGFAIDDSGPPLEQNGGSFIQAGFQSWGITDVLDPLCGPGVCEADLSKGLAALIQKYPADRFSLLSWTADSTISGFYLIPVPEFTAQLLKMTSDVILPSTNARAFIVVGSHHTMLGAPTNVSQNSVFLLPWLTQQVTSDPAWSSVIP